MRTLTGDYYDAAFPLFPPDSLARFYLERVKKAVWEGGIELWEGDCAGQTTLSEKHMCFARYLVATGRLGEDAERALGEQW